MSRIRVDELATRDNSVVKNIATLVDDLGNEAIVSESGEESIPSALNKRRGFIVSDTDPSTDDPQVYDVYPHLHWWDGEFLRERNEANDGWLNLSVMYGNELIPYVLSGATTGGVILPRGNTSQRPDGEDGLIRYNDETNEFEGYRDGAWGSIGGGATLLSVRWEYNRDAIPAGEVAYDGQELSRATYSGVWDLLNTPEWQHLLIDDTVWLADPAQRGKFSNGNGVDTFRCPDFNGKSAGSFGAVYLTGDGEKSAGEAGVIRQDEMQQITALAIGQAGDRASYASAQGAFSLVGPSGAGSAQGGGASANKDLEFDSANSPDARTNTYTHGTDVTGCWVGKFFGSVVNVGSADAAQLASDYANLNAAFQTLDGQIDFTIIYPNGGTEMSPANVASDSRYVETSPFPDHSVICKAEILVSGLWTELPYSAASSSANAFGVNAALYDGDIVIQTGANGLSQRASYTGNPTGNTANISGPLPCRVKVWKVKGATS